MVAGEGKSGLQSDDGIFGTSSLRSEASLKECFPYRKSAAASAAGATPHVLSCQSCGSCRLVRDGLRRLSDGRVVQRFCCKDCGFRFSEKLLNTPAGIGVNAKYAQEEAKNLSSATEAKTVAGDNPIKRMKKSGTRSNLLLISDEARGFITEFMAYLDREGYADEIQYPTTLSHLVKDGANLLDPENVKKVIAEQRKRNGEPWTSSMKMLAVCAYDAFCTMREITWRKPVYHQNEATIYVPDEKELDLLISAARKKMATFLSCLKETFADPSEIIYADWKDLKDNVFSINHPVKNHLPGKYELTPQLVAMINALPKKNNRIFATSYKALYSSFLVLRRNAAKKFENPALLNITFKSYRHWGGTKIAQLSNGNVLIVKKLLRHKRIESSMKYIHMIEFKDEDYDIFVATTPEEIQALGKVGAAKYDELTFSGVQMHFYRKPKRFGGLGKLDDKSEKGVDRFLSSSNGDISRIQSSLSFWQNLARKVDFESVVAEPSFNCNKESSEAEH